MSDAYQSFERLRQRLVAEGIGQSVSHVYLGDYVTLDDA